VTDGGAPAGALRGLRVVDAATLVAGPLLATLLGDHGADVVKIEHPRGDALRVLGPEREGVGLWWALVGRNKRSVTLDLSHARGRDLALGLARDADVLIEGFRPGTLERWGLGPDVLHEANPGLVLVRVSGFGQTGPRASLPGFGTLAEAFSGFAHLTGEADGPPTLPGFALGDGVAALAGAFGVLAALRHRDATGAGQTIDLSLYEPLHWLLGPHSTIYDQTGAVPTRSGNRVDFTAPRNAYRTADGHWVAITASTQSVADRILRVVGRDDLVGQPWFATPTGRAAHGDELDGVVAAWIAERPRDEVLRAFDAGEAPCAPVLAADGIAEDPHFAARGSLVRPLHPVLGPVAMPAPVPRLTGTPGLVRRPAPSLGEHTREVLGLDAEEHAALVAAGVC
jgi:crotonobetainyl-CoA:carnitine CoA-transferase CaiB-like acyl-CoA transferase